MCVNWKTPQKFKSIPRLFSMICLHPAYYGQFSCQESVNRNQEIKQSAMDMQYQSEKIKREFIVTLLLSDLKSQAS